MVQPDGNIKVMDFGIARAKNSHLTQDNSVLGTAHYVSPEQTQGKELGPTTDIYSLGIVMYEAATGQVPFQGDDAISVALKQVNEQPKPPSQLNPAVDPSLESIILKCMQKNPADRFQTAQELYHVLRDYLAGRMAQVNSATAVLPGSAAAVAATSKLEPGQGMAPGNTASMPRVSRTGQYRPQRATEEAAEQEEERDRKRKRNIVIGAVCGVIAAVAIVFALVNVLGSASKTYPVPNLAGMTADEAQTAITQDGHFKMGETKESYSSSVEQGKVMDQDPRASRQMPEGTIINIVISKGEEPKEQVSVPNLTNMTPKEAQEACTKVGLTAVAGDEVEDDNIEEGRIAKQDVEADSSAEKGTKVTYHISKGTSQVVIPNVVGDSEDSATTTLKNAGFEVSVQYSESSDSVGKVISTSPRQRGQGHQHQPQERQLRDQGQHRHHHRGQGALQGQRAQRPRHDLLRRCRQAQGQRLLRRPCQRLQQQRHCDGSVRDHRHQGRHHLPHHQGGVQRQRRLRQQRQRHRNQRWQQRRHGRQHAAVGPATETQTSRDAHSTRMRVPAFALGQLAAHLHFHERVFGPSLHFYERIIGSTAHFYEGIGATGPADAARVVSDSS